MELIGKTNIDFIGMRKFSFIISSVIAIIGLIGVIQMGRGAANMGIDFSGGTAVQLKFSQPVHIDQARSALAKHDLKEASLQEIKEGNKLLVKVGKTVTAGANVAPTIEDAFKKEF